MFPRRSNLNINDVLGDFSLTLVDTLDMLAVVGNASEFRRAAQLVIDNLSFHKNSTVQVFESNIRYVAFVWRCARGACISVWDVCGV